MFIAIDEKSKFNPLPLDFEVKTYKFSQQETNYQLSKSHRQEMLIQYWNLEVF